MKAEQKYKPGKGLKITELWAWIGVEPDGGEGVLGAMIGPLGFVPLVGADRDRIESYRDYAKAIQKAAGRPVKLVRYYGMDVREILK